MALFQLYAGGGQAERLSEILAVARKNGFINYKLNDYLHEDRDEEVSIRLVKRPCWIDAGETRVLGQHEK
jgi:hypothetical protein